MKRYRSLLWLLACLCFFTTAQASSLVPDPPTPGSNGPLCEGDGTNLMLLANPPATGGPFSYSWSGPNGFSSSDENPVINNPTTTNAGLYTVTIQDGTGSASGSVSVTVNKTPDQPFITTSSNTVCERGSITLVAPTYAGATVVYDWISPNGNFINSPNFPINGANADDQGDYSVMVTVNGCTSASSPVYSLDVVLTPTAVEDMDSIGVDRTSTTIDVLANDDVAGTIGGYQLSVTNQASNGSITDLGDGSFEYTPNDNFVGMDGFTYMLCSNTCETLCSEANVTIRVTAGKDCTAPKVLTPNGDGVNDAFKVNCLEFYPEAELTVFNRYGDRVYRGQNYRNDWMGTLNGEDLPVGTYYYVLKLNNSTNDVLSGYTMLTR